MKFAVAILSFFDNENMVEVIEAPTLADALLKHSLLSEYESDYREFVEGKTLEEMKRCFFDSDMSIDVVELGD